MHDADIAPADCSVYIKYITYQRDMDCMILLLQAYNMLSQDCSKTACTRCPERKVIECSMLSYTQ